LFLLPTTSLSIAHDFYKCHSDKPKAVPKGNIFYCPSFPRLLLSSSHLSLLSSDPSRTKSEEVCGLALLPMNRRDVRNITTTDDIMITIYMILLTFTDGQRKYHVAVPHPLLFIVAGSVHIHL
jgi:hypothetical protein